MTSDDDPPTPGETLESMIQDPETKGVKFSSVSYDGELFTFGLGDESEETMIELAAAALLHSSRVAADDETEFLKKVVEEYNFQKKNGVLDML
jgi:hypothetical protein